MIFILGLVALVCYANADSTFYTAAVFEHKRFGTWNDSRSSIVPTNLKFYKIATEVAKSKGADIIVFPEYGLLPADDRNELKFYAETVPDPTLLDVNPCIKPNDYKKSFILYNLSCFARNNSIFVVGNMIEIQSCAWDNDCPDDGVFLFNTNLVFDRNGKLLLKYHKENLFQEYGINSAREEQLPVFETDFGRFSTFICFDIQFNRMGEVSKAYDVDAVAYPTMWDEEPPELTSLQVQESWSVTHNITLLAAGNNDPEFASVGSGIYNGASSTVGYTYNPDGVSKLLVARVPRRGSRLTSSHSSITAITLDGHWPFNEDGKAVKTECSELLLNPNDTVDFRCYSENIDGYTFIELNKSSGEVSGCNNGMCCSVYYESLGLKNRYFLGVFNGTTRSFNSSGWSEESCVLTICEAYKNKTCAIFPRKSKTIFKSIILKANFTSVDIYPSIMDSGMRLVPHVEWSAISCEETGHDGCLSFSKTKGGRAIIAFGMKGRAYSRDPPREGKNSSDSQTKPIVYFTVIIFFSTLASMCYVLLFTHTELSLII